MALNCVYYRVRHANQYTLIGRHPTFWLEEIFHRALGRVSAIDSILSSSLNFDKKISIVFIYIVRQMCSNYFNWDFGTAKFQDFSIFPFWRSQSTLLSFFFLFSFNPDMLPNCSTICKEHLRDSVSLDLRVVSSANCEIFASLRLGRLTPLQFGSRRIFEANNSTDKINRSGLNGHP